MNMYTANATRRRQAKSAHMTKRISRCLLDVTSKVGNKLAAVDRSADGSLRVTACTCCTRFVWKRTPGLKAPESGSLSCTPTADDVTNPSLLPVEVASGIVDVAS